MVQKNSCVIQISSQSFLFLCIFLYWGILRLMVLVLFFSCFLYCSSSFVYSQVRVWTACDAPRAELRVFPRSPTAQSLPLLELGNKLWDSSPGRVISDKIKKKKAAINRVHCKQVVCQLECKEFNLTQLLTVIVHIFILILFTNKRERKSRIM